MVKYKRPKTKKERDKKRQERIDRAREVLHGKSDKMAQ